MTQQIVASNEMLAYFEDIKEKINIAHKLASVAKSKGYDPDTKVEVALAENMAQRVVGLISVLAPQIVNSGVVEKIEELEKQYGALDWRVALKIAEEIALEKFCKFKDKKEALEIGVRTGFAYSTVGVVSSPLDGLINIDFKDRLDKRGQYICLNFAGPIRNAGGTNAAVCVIIADYVRKKMSFDVYDASEEEVKRSITEIRDYDERISPRQHHPSDEELQFLFKNIPVEVSGDPSEAMEVSNYKDLPRIPTNQIRSGFCLINTDCIPLKAPKLWKQLEKWGKDFDLEQWNFLAELINIQKKAKSHGQEKKDKKGISPNYSYLSDLVAGRPVLSAPLAQGGLRLRYGRSRISGYSSQSIHPATMYILNSYIATGTQLKVERPGKASSMTNCDLIEGPIVKLEDESVVYVDTLKKAKELLPKVKKILFLGDVLICYGDFFNRAHSLVPVGYCEEWWAQEFEKSIIASFGTLDFEKAAEFTQVNHEIIEQLVKNPLLVYPEATISIKLSKTLKISIHPKYCYHWNNIKKDDMLLLFDLLDKSNIIKEDNEIKKIVVSKKHLGKITLELAGIPHIIANNEFIVIEKDHANSLFVMFDLENRKIDELKQLFLSNQDKLNLELINNISQISIKDKSGTFIGARMGRPEKAKQRKLTGSPQVLFPVSDEGGKMRSVNAALAEKKITSSFAIYNCGVCNKRVVYPTCDVCWNKTNRLYKCKYCGYLDSEKCQKHGETILHEKLELSIVNHFSNCLKKLGLQTFPELIKGVRGTSNKDHIPEHLAKGILRSRNDIYVFKDGTTRYDMTQLPITHFKPKEIGTSIEKLKELGYKQDIYGKLLVNDEQIIELRPQDIILPACDQSTDEGADKVLFRVARFIDELLEKFYNIQRFYDLKNEKDLVGHLVICLAPHTSAGMVGRIIGFSNTQGFLAHPYMHAATRRDCDGDEACVLLVMDAFLNFSKQYLPASRGSTMDAPLVLTSVLNPSEVDDMAFDVDVEWKYPLELYQAAQEFKQPWDVKIKQIKSRLRTPEQYEGMGFTHDIIDINNTVKCSAYKTLPTMEEKLKGQMDLAEKIRAVDSKEVATLVIEKHFLKDTKGNLRKFSMQEFRCVNCNEKYRRPPLIGKCIKCKNGKIIFTISEGSIIKYLGPSISLAKKYNVSPYVVQTLELLQQRVEGVFGKEKEKQVGLGAWFET